MIRAVNLGDNTEKTVQPKEVQALSLSNVWLELVDPTEEELRHVSDATEVPINFLRLPQTSGVVDLRLEQDFGIIYFLVLQDVVSTKNAYPIVMVFSKGFLVTVTKREVQPIVDVAKERMSKAKIDPPVQVTYFIIDEIVANHYLQIEKLENLTATMEEEVVEKTSPDTLKKIFRLKSNMISFNKILWYERGLVFNLKKCNGNCMDAKSRALFETTHEELTRQVDIVETYREILSDAINVHLSAISNKINLSTALLALFVLFTAQFFVGMANNLLVTPPMTTFPKNNNAYPDALAYAIAGGNWTLTTHFIIDMGIIAMAVVALALAVHKSNAYRALSVGGLIAVLFAFASGLRFAASNFTVDAISYQMAGGFISGFILFLVMAMLMYRDIAAQAG